MIHGKIAKRSLSAVAIMGLLSFGACTIAMPDLVFTNGNSSEQNAGTKDIVAHASTELLFGAIGLNATGSDGARSEIRKSLSSQCQGGKIENLSEAINLLNYYVYQKVTITEHASCVMPKN